MDTKCGSCSGANDESGVVKTLPTAKKLNSQTYPAGAPPPNLSALAAISWVTGSVSVSSVSHYLGDLGQFPGL